MANPNRGRFYLNRRTIASIAKGGDDGLNEALNDVAQEVAQRAGPSATTDVYQTDRRVVGVVVPASEQARRGSATRAAQSVAADPRVAGPRVPFRSQAQWRWTFANMPESARGRARASKRYSQLPRRVVRS